MQSKNWSATSKKCWYSACLRLITQHGCAFGIFCNPTRDSCEREYALEASLSRYFDTLCYCVPLSTYADLNVTTRKPGCFSGRVSRTVHGGSTYVSGIDPPYLFFYRSRCTILHSSYLAPDHATPCHSHRVADWPPLPVLRYRISRLPGLVG